MINILLFMQPLMNTVVIDIWQKYAEIVTVLMCYSIKNF